MENNFVKELEYSLQNKTSKIHHEISNDLGMYMSKLTIDGKVHSEGVAATETEAKNVAARILLSKVRGNALEQMAEDFNEISLNADPNNSNNANFSSARQDLTDDKSSNEVTNNPVGYLQEFCAQKGYQLPEYRSNKSGLDHSPIFTSECIVNINGRKFVGQGKGKSKQISKKASAADVLRQIRENNNINESQLVNDVSQVADSSSDQSNEMISETLSNFTIQSSIQSPTANESMGNPIGYLQEFCIQNGYSLPTYEESIRSGSDHEPKFTIKCKVTIDGKVIVGEGEGRSKQVSKKASAEDIIRKLGQSNNSSRNGSKTGDSGTDDNEKLIGYLSQTFSYNPKLNVCESNDYNDCEKLDKIAAIIGCNVSYIETNNNKVMLRLTITHLSNNTLMIAYGSSHNGLEAAKEIAAKKAILMLKVLNS